MIHFNGINPRTGSYLVPPIAEQDLLELLDPAGPGDRTELRSYLHRKLPNAGLPSILNEYDPAEAGWGIIFHENEQRESIDAARLLIEHRKETVPEEHLKVLSYRTGQSTNKWLAEQGVGSGHIDPAKVPYYLLIVGDPENIPFAFSQRLGLEYRVGRLPFHEPWQLTNYVSSLICHEKGEAQARPKDLFVFAPEHDPATQLSCRYLAEPLVARFNDRLPVDALLRNGASKNKLIERLRAGPPRFIFSASHGLGLEADDEAQSSQQGALVCSRSSISEKPLTPEDYFGAIDISDDMDLTGTMAFFFACFSAATPSHDRFFRRNGNPQPLAKESFFSALPRRMLAKPSGAALAVIGHIDRAWGCSILNERSDMLLIPFENALARVLDGKPCGHALNDFYDRYASYSIELTDLLETRELGGNVDDREIVFAWTRRNDAGGYVFLGDPAARL
jgi:hypothetical protein